jgi:hypothetical protein
MKVGNLKHSFMLLAIVVKLKKSFFWGNFSKLGICDQIFPFQNIFLKMAKIRHKKPSGR